MGFGTLFVLAVAVVAPCTIKLLLDDAIYTSYQSVSLGAIQQVASCRRVVESSRSVFVQVVIENSYQVANTLDVPSELQTWQCEPRWLELQHSLDRFDRGQQLAETISLPSNTDVNCYVLPQSTQKTCCSLSCSICSFWACDVCTNTQHQHSCSLDRLSFFTPEQLQDGGKPELSSMQRTEQNADTAVLSRASAPESAVPGASPRWLAATPQVVEPDDRAVTQTEEDETSKQQSTLLWKVASEQGDRYGLDEKSLGPHNAAGDVEGVDAFGTSGAVGNKCYTATLVDLMKKASRPLHNSNHHGLAEPTAATSHPAASWTLLLPPVLPGLEQQSSVVDAVCLAETAVGTTFAGCDAEVSLTESLLSLSPACVGPDVAANTTAMVEGVQQQASREAAVQQYEQPTSLQAANDLSTYLTPALILQTLDKYGELVLQQWCI